MTDNQNSPTNTAQANPSPPSVPPTPVPATPPMIALSPSELTSLNTLMREPSAIPTDNPLLPLAREVQSVAGALSRCQSGQFCAEDVVPSPDLRASQSFNIGTIEGSIIVQPGKVKARWQF